MLNLRLKVSDDAMADLCPHEPVSKVRAGLSPCVLWFYCGAGPHTTEGVLAPALFIGGDVQGPNDHMQSMDPKQQQICPGLACLGTCSHKLDPDRGR